ncbi:MAG: Membrane protein [Ramlibacter sp.]|nr:Membrane protein [Ramlibacter sp.]
MKSKSTAMSASNHPSASASASTGASKVPQVILMFWVIKILATTVGETGGDAVSMTLNLGYAVASLIFLAFFGAALVAQLAASRYHPFRYWLLVVATTTVGTTMSDYLDRTVGLGYIKSSILLFCGVLVLLFAWRRVVGHVRFEDITTRREEVFYWMTILVSNTLGTALGDYVATTAGFGFERGALIFSGLLAIVAVLHFWAKKIPASVLFWSAYVLTRPLGATLGDTLTKSHNEGGLALGRIGSSLTIAALMVVGILIMTRVERRPQPQALRA